MRESTTRTEPSGTGIAAIVPVRPGDREAQDEAMPDDAPPSWTAGRSSRLRARGSLTHRRSSGAATIRRKTKERAR